MSKKMQILTISKCLPYIAGPSVFAFEEAKMLVKMGHGVDFLTYARYPNGAIDNFDISILKKNGVNFYFAKPPKTGKTVGSLLEIALFSKALEIISKKKPDFINAHYAIPHGLIAVTLSKLFNIPSVVTV